MIRLRLLVAVLVCIVSGLTIADAQDPETKPKPGANNEPKESSPDKATENLTPLKLVIHTELPANSLLTLFEERAVHAGIAQAVDATEASPGKDPKASAARISVKFDFPSDRPAETHLAVLRNFARTGGVNGFVHVNFFEVGPASVADGRNREPYATIEAGREVPYSAVLKVMKSLTDIGITSVTFQPDPTTSASNAAQPHNITLLLLEADWSKSPSAKEIESDLQTALKDVSLPERFRSSLLLAGPRILFAEENIAIYQPKDLAALIAWLDKHKLIRSRVPFGAAALSGSTAVDPSQPQAKPQMDVTAESNYCDLSGVLSPQSAEPQSEHPFVKSWLAWDWTVTTRSTGNQVTVQYQLQQVQRALGQSGHEKKQRQQYFYNSFELPAGRFAIVHGFAGSKPRQTQGATISVESIPVSGLQPLLLVGRAEPLPKASAALKIPELIVPVTNQGYNTLAKGRSQGSSGMMGAGGSGAMSSGRGPSRSPSTSGAKQGEINVFYLRHSKADSVATLLGQLWTKDLNVTVDARTNTIFVRGEKTQIDEIEKLLKVLDVPETDAKVKVIPQGAGTTTDPSIPALDPRSESRPGTLSGSSNSAVQTASKPGLSGGASESLQTTTLKQQYAVSNQQAKELAQQLREFQKTSPKDQAGQDLTKSKLRQAVVEAFSLRQRLQKAELAEFEDRIQDLRQSLILRERIQDQIIDHRVDDLLNPDKDWEPNASKPTPSSNNRSANQESSPATTSNVVNPNQPTPASSPIVVSAGRDNGVIIRSAEEFNRLLDETTAEVVKLEDEWNQLKVEAITTVVDMDGMSVRKLESRNLTDEELQKRYPLHKNALIRARRRLQLINDELTAQLKLLELEVQSARAKLTAETNDLARIKQLRAKGVISGQEFEQHETKVKAAELNLQKVMLVLELYHKIEMPTEKAKSPAAAEIRKN